MRILMLWTDERSPNLGVRALGEGTAALCRRLWPTATIDSQNYGHGPAPVNIGSSRSLARELVTNARGMKSWVRSYDLVVDTRAGDSFTDIYGLERLRQMCAMAEFVRQCGVPLVMGPQTIGPFTTHRGKALGAWSLRAATAVLARDETSAAAAFERFRRVDATTTDVVFAIDIPRPEGDRDVIVNPSGLLWSTDGHGDHEQYQAHLRRIIEGLLERGRQVSLLAHVLRSDNPRDHNPDDDEPAVAALAAEYGLEQVVPRDLQHARAVLGGAQLVIGSRMHACLNALSVGTPAVPLAYSRKFAPLLKGLGWGHVVDLHQAGDPAGEVLATVDHLGPDTRTEVARARQTAAARLLAAGAVLRRVADQTTAREASSGLEAAVQAVVASGNCSGCGACALLDERISMELDADGYLRPVFGPAPESGAVDPDVDLARVQRFNASCPGRGVRAQQPPGTVRHPQLGPIRGSWVAWATDERLRSTGSSGGALSALSAWLLQSDTVDEIVAARADPNDRTCTATARLVDEADVLDAAGSRYAPVGNAALARLDGRAGFVGKPCEASAVRVMAQVDGAQAPVILSFFCAGTPSQRATEQLLSQLQVDKPVKDLWYRGHGWPGHFTVTDQTGAEHRMDYQQSWGDNLGPTIQWRCKICPDGVGESADVVAADFWHSDEEGYPSFEEADGVSALIARTELGARVVAAAVAAGVIEAQPLDPDDLAGVQPFQVKRRSTLWGRLVGARAAGLQVPAYSGFGLWYLAAQQPRENLRAARGTFSRRRAASGRGRRGSRGDLAH